MSEDATLVASELVTNAVLHSGCGPDDRINLDARWSRGCHNVVLLMLEQTLTKGEQSLVNKGRVDKVIEIRHEFQEAMREESMAKISELTGRNVTAMLSANHVNPDLGAEIFVLDGPPRLQRAQRPRLTDVTDGDG